MHSSKIIVGVDEAGRGSIAGPVVAGAVLEDSRLRKRKLIQDSKVLQPEEREKAFQWITKELPYGYGIVEADVIDAKGILYATELAMQKAIAMLAQVIKPTYLLVDGRDHFWFDYPHTSIVRGDESEPCISAASIIAKVTRDRIMMQRAKVFSDYFFDQHKGYGTELHYKCIKKHGPCALHRKTYLESFYEELTS